MRSDIVSYNVRHGIKIGLNYKFRVQAINAVG